MKALNAELKTVSTADVSARTIGQTVQHCLSKPYTLKKINRVATERFTVENLQYTEAFMNYLSGVDPHRLRFMDESRVRLPEVAYWL